MRLDFLARRLKFSWLSISRRRRRTRRSGSRETRGIKYSRFYRWRQPRLSHLALHRFPIPAGAASHLADLATARVEHPPVFRLSPCSACRDTRIEFVKEARFPPPLLRGPLLLSFLSRQRFVPVALFCHTVEMSPKNKAAVDKTLPVSPNFVDFFSRNDNN